MTGSPNPRHARRRRGFGWCVCPICWTQFWWLSTLKKHWMKEHDQ